MQKYETMKKIIAVAMLSVLAYAAFMMWYIDKTYDMDKHLTAAIHEYNLARVADNTYDTHKITYEVIHTTPISVIFNDYTKAVPAEVYEKIKCYI